MRAEVGEVVPELGVTKPEEGLLGVMTPGLFLCLASSGGGAGARSVGGSSLSAGFM